MSADYLMATRCLQENLSLLDGIQTPESMALWNLSNALLVVCDALQGIETRVAVIENQARKAR